VFIKKQKPAHTANSTCSRRGPAPSEPAAPPLTGGQQYAAAAMNAIERGAGSRGYPSACSPRNTRALGVYTPAKSGMGYRRGTVRRRPGLSRCWRSGGKHTTQEYRLTAEAGLAWRERGKEERLENTHNTAVQDDS
jgi:hypothetical protein